MHALIFGCRWIRHKFPMPERLQLTGHGGFLWKFQLFPRVLNGFFELLLIRNNKTDASQLSRIVALRFLFSPSVLFLFPNFWPQMIMPCGCLNFCKPLPGLQYIRQVFVSFNHCELRETCPLFR